jgi:hypothetical protein
MLNEKPDIEKRLFFNNRLSLFIIKKKIDGITQFMTPCQRAMRKDGLSLD